MEKPSQPIHGYNQIQQVLLPDIEIPVALSPTWFCRKNALQRLTEPGIIDVIDLKFNEDVVFRLKLPGYFVANTEFQVISVQLVFYVVAVDALYLVIFFKINGLIFMRAVA